MFICSLCVGDEVGCILKSREGEGEWKAIVILMEKNMKVSSIIRWSLIATLQQFNSTKVSYLLP